MEYMYGILLRITLTREKVAVNGCEPSQDASTCNLYPNDKNKYVENVAKLSGLGSGQNKILLITYFGIDTCFSLFRLPDS